MTTGKTQNSAGLSDRQKSLLDFIRLHPGCITADLAIHMNEKPRALAVTLRSLMQRQLIGEQRPMGWQFGDYDTRWYPELES